MGIYVETRFVDGDDDDAETITRRMGQTIDLRIGDIVAFHEIDNGNQAWRITQRWVDFYDQSESQSDTSFVSYKCERFTP